VNQAMTDNDFRIAEEILADKDVVLVRVSGSLDANTYVRFEDALESLLARGHYKLAVDLSNVEYISSAGAGVFIGSLPHAQEYHGDIVLINPSANVREVFDLLGLTGVFQIFNDVPAALAAF
jgi:anti-sigma B factor antagonist